MDGALLASRTAASLPNGVSLASIEFYPMIVVAMQQQFVSPMT